MLDASNRAVRLLDSGTSHWNPRRHEQLVGVESANWQAHEADAHEIDAGGDRSGRTWDIRDQLLDDGTGSK